VQKVRGEVVRALVGVGRWRLDVKPGPPPALATVSLGTEGSFADVIDLVSAVCRPRSGLVLDRLSFSRTPNGVGLQMTATALGGVS
jgi:hypothetical protein